MDKKQKVNQAATDLAVTMPLLGRNIFKFAEQGPPKEITKAVGEVLMCISYCKNCTTTEISTKLHRPKSNLTPIIDKLVKDGLVIRSADTNDRRVINISLSPQGEEYVEIIKGHVQENIAIMLNHLEEVEVTEFHEAIKVIGKLVRKINQCRK